MVLSKKEKKGSTAIVYDWKKKEDSSTVKIHGSYLTLKQTLNSVGKWKRSMEYDYKQKHGMGPTKP